MSEAIKKEIAILESWKLKLAIISAIVFPSITATAAFYGLKSEMKDQQMAAAEKIAAFRVEAQREFVDRETAKELRDDMRALQTSVNELNILLKKGR